VKRGEEVKCLVDYDLFDFNIKGEKGCFIKKDEVSSKHLIWFPCNSEWAELRRDQFERMSNSGYVPAKYKSFIKRVKTLEYTLIT
tara:strand:+ start:470 stop:724 length:255 start_codon:yes stop_codon:yes gene_type:complete